MKFKLSSMDEAMNQSPMHTRLQLLGVPCFSNSDTLPSRMGHKQLLLLARLLMEQRPLTRESLIAFLWPEADEIRARGSLRQALYVIRELLGENTVTANRQTISVSLHRNIDLSMFMQAVHERRWREAAMLYRGRLLEGVQLKDATDADLWLELERRRLARLFETAAFAVLREPRDKYEPFERLLIARRLRDAAPHSAVHWQRLLEELAEVRTQDEWRIECAALGARIDTGQIDDVHGAKALLQCRVNHETRGKSLSPIAG